MDNQFFVKKAFRIFVINSILSSAGVVLGTFVDAVILGNAFGEIGLSVLAVAMPVYMVYNLVGFAFGVGGSLKVSECIGAEDLEGVRKHFTVTILFSLLTGLLISLLGTIFLPEMIRISGGLDLIASNEYLWLIVLSAPIFIMAPIISLLIRSDADPFLSTLGISVSVAVNLFLDLILIFGLNMGIFGAALAMVLGQASAIAVYLAHFFKKHNHLIFCRVSPKLKDGYQIFHGGFGIASAFIYQGITLIIINNLLSREVGISGLAVYNILFNVSLFAYAIFDGISLALAPLVATFAGEKDTDGVYYTMRLSLKTAMLMGAACGLVLYFFAEPIGAMFGVYENLGQIAQTIQVFAFAVIPTCFNCVIAHFYQSTKRRTFAGIIYFMRGFLLLILFSVWLIPANGVLGTAMAILAAESATMVLILIAAATLRKKGAYRNLLLFEEPVIEKDLLFETTLSSDIKELQGCVEEIEAFCEKLNIDRKTAYFINLTIEELAANIITFGFNDGKDHYIQIKIAQIQEDIYIRLRDDSTSYNPFEESEKPDEELNYLGVSIVRAKAKSFAYNRTLVFNNLLIIL